MPDAGSEVDRGRSRPIALSRLRFAEKAHAFTIWNTERRRDRAALEASEARLAVAQRIASIGSFELDMASGELTSSDEELRILGLDPGQELSGDEFIAMVHPDDRPAVVALWADTVETGAPFDHAYRVIRPGGEVRWVRSRAVADLAADGTRARLTGTMIDETDRVEAEQVRRAAEIRFEIGFEQSSIGAVIADLEGNPVRVNPAMCDFLGRDNDLLVGQPWGSHPDEVPLREAVLARVAAGHDSYKDERRYIRPDGSVVWASSHVTLVRDESGEPQYFFAQLQDITGRKQLEEELAHQALHDSLTGLPNQALLGDRLVHGLAGSRRRHSKLGVMLLGLDHFKVFNDSCGHASGDDLLRHTAVRIAAAIRPGDTVGRFGGDEFVVVCDDISPRKAVEIAEQVLEAVGQPHLIPGQDATATASIGIAIADVDATPESLLRDAEAAMYRAKQRGRGRIELFDDALRLKVQHRSTTASALRRAIDQTELTVHYQPIIELTSMVVVGAEALVRWQDPSRGLVDPLDFIPLAEETGLIVPVGAWVLEQACEQLVRWQQSRPAMSVAVNLSVRQLTEPDIVDLIAGVLRRTGMSPGTLCLELTESVLMDDVDYFGRTLAGLKDLGVRLALDDFGTGYSSLSYLKRFPIDIVKVDRAFVDGLGTDPHDSALVAAIVAMADALDLDVIAEGVETEEQLANLTSLDCHSAQGYYLARPMPAATMTRMLVDASPTHEGESQGFAV